MVSLEMCPRISKSLVSGSGSTPLGVNGELALPENASVDSDLGRVGLNVDAGDWEGGRELGSGSGDKGLA